MRFTVSRTSHMYTSGYDYPGEYEEYARELSEELAHPCHVHIETHYTRWRSQNPDGTYDVTEAEPYDRYMVVTEFDSLEELHAALLASGYQWVIDNESIELYDDYRE